jgi:hypothetical protein
LPEYFPAIYSEFIASGHSEDPTSRRIFLISTTSQRHFPYLQPLFPSHLSPNLAQCTRMPSVAQTVGPNTPAAEQSTLAPTKIQHKMSPNRTRSQLEPFLESSGQAFLFDPFTSESVSRVLPASLATYDGLLALCI